MKVQQKLFQSIKAHKITHRYLYKKAFQINIKYTMFYLNKKQF